jgi:septal ring factor EnvC (AmiA/AmiB activator)
VHAKGEGCACKHASHCQLQYRVICCCLRSEADSQAASLRSQAAAREERLNAQHACRLAQLQSELDAQAAAAADTEAALAAARAQVEHLTGQVSIALNNTASNCAHELPWPASMRLALLRSCCRSPPNPMLILACLCRVG